MNFLNKIIEYKKQEVEESKSNSKVNINEMQALCEEMNPCISFFSALNCNKLKQTPSLIAEIKKASPSKGIIRKDFDPMSISKAYNNSGVSAISVLTDKNFFMGSVEYLKLVKAVVDVPVLRKDFIIDPFQVYETRLMGADIILLIASVMSPSQLVEFYEIAKDAGLECLIEVHNKKEFNFVWENNLPIIGINNRNLETFEVSIKNTLDLTKGKNLPAIKDKHVISESGIKDYNDIKKLQERGISGFLVGESLMKEENIEFAVLKLLGKV